MYDALGSLFGVRMLRAATLEPEDPEGGNLSITPDDGSDEGNSGGDSSDDD
jgi:hypothetical protein